MTPSQFEACIIRKSMAGSGVEGARLVLIDGVAIDEAAKQVDMTSSNVSLAIDRIFARHNVYASAYKSGARPMTTAQFEACLVRPGCSKGGIDGAFDVIFKGSSIRQAAHDNDAAYRSVHEGLKRIRARDAALFAAYGGPK